MKQCSLEEIAKHSKPDDLWLIIHNKVYDLTSFLHDHPGGSAILLKYGGKDATKAFDVVHPPDIITKLLPPSVLIGELDQDSAKHVSKLQSELTPEEQEIKEARARMPPLSEMLNLHDFEFVAKQVMRKDGWAYYSSAADDEITMRENHQVYHRIWLKPRILRNVKYITTETRILGFRSTLPIYITATALGRLGHPEGEKVLTRAAGTRGIIQMVPTLSSCSLAEITDARLNNQIQFFQLYVNDDRRVTERLVKEAEQRGCKALCITVDAPTLAKREKDMRLKFVEKEPDVQSNNIDRSQGAARAIGSFIDAGLCWDDLRWFRSITNMKIILKGVQCGEDAVEAYRRGVDGIILSNHGGRQLEFARSSIEVLQEVTDYLKKYVGNYSRMEIFVDGGVRRGTDVFKAIAMGAKAVGIGRPFLYAMSSYGQEGVERAIDILIDEIEMCMRMMGVCSIQEVEQWCASGKVRDYLCLDNLNQHVVPVPRDNLYEITYDTMHTPKLSSKL
ncbi:hypothetical protein MP638_005805 [Amoeboaphelidium occidentale]|nr:hypothetical protein MP638_005805 [Amoeboaphelidium occidentale]